MNVASERICPRVGDWQATWEPGERERTCYRRAECGELVVYNPTSGEDRVRLECLVNRPVK